MESFSVFRRIKSAGRVARSTPKSLIYWPIAAVDAPASAGDLLRRGYFREIDRSRGVRMARVVRGGLIQATLCEPATSPVEKIKRAMIDKHVALIAEAAGKGAQVVCLQELFYGPYFCAEQEIKWY